MVFFFKSWGISTELWLHLALTASEGRETGLSVLSCLPGTYNVQGFPLPFHNFPSSLWFRRSGASKACLSRTRGKLSYLFRESPVVFPVDIIPLPPVVQELPVASAYHTQCLARVYSSHIIPALYRKSLTWITNPMVDPKYAGCLIAGSLNRPPTRELSHQQVPERRGEMGTRAVDCTIVGECCDCFWCSPDNEVRLGAIARGEVSGEAEEVGAIAGRLNASCTGFMRTRFRSRWI